MRAVLRDPFGALVALTPERAVTDGRRVAWHVLNARNESRAFELYREMFGWAPVGLVDGSRGELVQLFSCDGSERVDGATTNAASLPHVHPRWLFFFHTHNLELSLAMVRDWGGLTLPVTTTPDGRRLAACDDPQGAAFGLWEATRR